jgi:hypothetical protein
LSDAVLPPSPPSPNAAERKVYQDAYNRVVGAARLEDIRLTSCKFDVEIEYHTIRQQEVATNAPILRRSFSSKHEIIGFDKETGVLAGLFNWHVEARRGKKRLLKAAASFLILYNDVPDVPEEPAFAFLARVGRFATYPYFRNFVAQLSWMSQSDLPIMPVLIEPLVGTPRGRSRPEKVESARPSQSAKGE